MVFQRKKTEKSTALSVRAIAAQVILQVLDQGKSLSTLLPEVQSQVKTTGFTFITGNHLWYLSRIASFRKYYKKNY